MRRQAAIVGIGQTEFSRNSGRSEPQLALEAIQAALSDAGLASRDVDGIVRYSYDSVSHAMLVRDLGIPDLRWYADLPLGGVAQCGTLAQSAAAIAAGIATTVVVFRALNERSGERFGRAERSLHERDGMLRAGGDRTPSGQFAGPYGLLAPGQVHAMRACRYMHDAAVDQETASRALAYIAITQRSYACANPAAMMREKPLDEDAYRASRMISWPLRLHDYCLESDGAVAFVVTGAARARELRGDPVYILAAHQSLYPHSEPLSLYAAADGEAARGNVRKLYADAGIAPGDVSVAQLYDVTTFGVLASLELYGLAGEHQGWRHVLDRGIGPDSPVPVNTHGGHLSEAYLHGMNHVTEAVRQLRGTAANQRPGVEFALVGCSGASSAVLAR